MKISEKGNLSKTYQGKYVADEATLESIEKHLDATAGNPHKVTASDVGSYTKDEVDGYVSGLSEQITSNYNDLSEDITNLRTTTQQSFDTVDKIVSGKADSDKVYSIEQVDELIAAGGGSSSYYVASTGLEIVDGVVIGIGTCHDEHIVIPELYNDGGIKKPVTAVRAGAFGVLLGSNGGFIKSITFPSSVERFDLSQSSSSIIDSEYCPNLSEIYMMNPGITWEDHGYPFRLLENAKDLYFAFTEKQYDNMNAGKRYTLITLKNENIAAGIVPTKHFGHFVTSAVIGDIDAALDELHNYAQALIGGEA